MSSVPFTDGRVSRNELCTAKLITTFYGTKFVPVSGWVREMSDEESGRYPVKVVGVRAANCRDMVDAELSRRHNDANVICLSADLIGEDLIDRMVRAWLVTEFEGGCHARRVDKIAAYEKDHTVQ